MTLNSQNIDMAVERLAGRVVETPLLNSPALDNIAGCRILLKAESLQRTGSFKYRGALNKLLGLDPAKRSKGVITYSAGNHGHAVAAAANELGMRAIIVMPDRAPQIKQDNCRWWGADVVLYDVETQDRAEVVDQLIAEHGLVFIPPFDDIEIMSGQATVGREACDQNGGGAFDALICPCSGGGLASGVVTAVTQRFPEVEVNLVEAEGYQKWRESLDSGLATRLSTLPPTDIDGIAGPLVGTRPLAALADHAVRLHSVCAEDTFRAMQLAYRYLKLVLEPAGATALAVVLNEPEQFQGKSVLVIGSGGNVDYSMFHKAMTHP